LDFCGNTFGEKLEKLLRIWCWGGTVKGGDLRLEEVGAANFVGRSYWIGPKF